MEVSLAAQWGTDNGATACSLITSIVTAMVKGRAVLRDVAKYKISSFTLLLKNKDGTLAGCIYIFDLRVSSRKYLG